MAYLFCYKIGIGISGLWYGWILGSIANTLFSWMMLLRIQRSKYKNITGKK
jgi:Na+-driven multidrug efflux pump